MSRSDLLALTPDALAALANRGLVKRAAKDLDAGTAPELTLADGALTAVFPDGATAVLPAEGGLETATCTCGAAGKCRHRVGAVLAYQREHAGAEPAGTEAAPAAPAEAATPAVITDDQLRDALGPHALKAAEATRKAGYTARLTWLGPERPAAAELPAATVSFLVPGLGYVHTDATGPARDTAIVLAVWAFREAEPGAATVAVGGANPEETLAATVDLAAQVLLDGAAGADAVLRASLQREAKALTRRRAHWPAGAVNDLIDQLQRYEDRSAAYDPHRLAVLLAEIPARAKAAAHPLGTPAAHVLGSEEADATPLTLVRLTGLGARVGTEGDRRTMELYLAQPETGMVLSIKRDWPIPEDGTVTGAEVASRRLAGCRIGALAAGNTVTEAATRTAARALKLGTGRLAKTQVLPLGLAWNDLPSSLRATDLGALADELGERPPALVRPRVAAESLRVLAVAETEPLGYDPASQRLAAEVTGPDGGTALVVVAHTSAAPGALEAAERAFTAGPLAVAGHVHRHRGRLIVEPTAILTADGPVVPDFAPGDDSADLAAAGDAAASEPVSAAIEDAISVCADLAHQGLRRSREPSRVRVEAAASALNRVGLQRAAMDFVHLSKALGNEDEGAKGAAWTAAAVRMLVTAELH
ncbi:SWIM zinc finger family protein [Glycomyces scopariae]